VSGTEHQRAEALQAQPPGQRHDQGCQLLAGVAADDGGTQDPVRAARGQHFRKTVGRVVGLAAIELAELDAIAIEARPAP